MLMTKQIIAALQSGIVAGRFSQVATKNKSSATGA
jgi:hypothetical protein